MAFEFKKLSDVEVVAEPLETANVLIEENGVIKRAPKNEIGAQADWAETDSSSPAFIKNKPVTGKELIYEWNFTPDNTTAEIYENVDIDLSSLFEDKETEFEVIVEQYCLENSYDNESGNWSEPEIMEDSISAWNDASWSYMKNVPLPFDPEYVVDYISIYSSGYDYNCEIDNHHYFCQSLADIMIINGLNFNFEDGSINNVTNGGAFMVFGDSPFKSIKIYKIVK
jgi:hypothetical protein